MPPKRAPPATERGLPYDLRKTRIPRSLLDLFIEDYGVERETERGYKPAKLIHETLQYVISRDSFLIFVFTFLHENLTDMTSNMTLALSYFGDFASWVPAARNKLMHALEEFANYMVAQFFLPLRASSVKTPQLTPTSLSTMLPSTPTSTKQRISLLRHDCLVRDRHRCVVSRKFDIAEARRRLNRGKSSTDDDGKLLESEPRGNFQYLEVAHILPHYLTKVASGDENMIQNKTCVTVYKGAIGI
ncbi:uncharacterized protein KD926_007458 [Aspergillus affinis]|uniref:uncharacterized protein n=1 Tax=Aspergillus affinis TaxID=1070780 RepID=UPI0022FDFDC8|nr:uncharacterized protein KD926_007458 [Aspergillus affinis]KAI9041042.1 hypothetical protein KD926_007458 [Aspergillus affinis]